MCFLFPALNFSPISSRIQISEPCKALPSVAATVEGCLDGTFVAAAASRHKMLRLDQISRRLSVIKRAISQQDNPDQIASHRKLDSVPSWVAKTPCGRQMQLEKFRRAKAQILNEIQSARLCRQDSFGRKRDTAFQFWQIQGETSCNCF